MALKSANQTIRWKERIGTMALGHTFKKVEEFLFDFTLYPAMIAFFGSVIGGLIMTMLSALACYLTLLFYDWSKRDWLGLELLKEVRDGEEQSGHLARFAQSMARKSNWLAFIFFSCYFDPFVATVYMRKGAEAYNGLTSRDWRIFWGSVAVANFWWTVMMTIAVESIRFALTWLGFI